MTIQFTRPGDVCPDSRDSDRATGFQMATGMFNIFPSSESSIASHPMFRRGWQVGFTERFTSPAGQSLRMPQGDDAHEARLAWTIGLIAGQYAHINAYRTPFCNTDSCGDCPTFEMYEPELDELVTYDQMRPTVLLVDCTVPGCWGRPNRACAIADDELYVHQGRRHHLREAVVSLDCSYCHATTGQPCTTLDGQPMKIMHNARFQLFNTLMRDASASN